MAVEGGKGGFKSNMVRFTMPGWYQLTQITETLLTATYSIQPVDLDRCSLMFNGCYELYNGVQCTYLLCSSNC
jgi:hypothetical protein